MSPNGVLCAAIISAARLAERLAGDRARVLERHGVPLLRHDAAALHEAVGEAQVAELHRAPQQQVLDDAAEADEHDRRGAHALQQVVDRRDAAVGVAGGAVEPEQLRRPIAIDRKTGAGDRARAQRILVRARVGRLQAHRVALELFDDGLQVVGDGRRLRRLRVRVRGEHRLAIAGRRAESARAGAPASPRSTARISCRCDMRYIVMSMSLRERAVCSRPAASSPQPATTSRSR